MIRMLKLQQQLELEQQQRSHLVSVGSRKSSFVNLRNSFVKISSAMLSRELSSRSNKVTSDYSSDAEQQMREESESERRDSMSSKVLAQWRRRGRAIGGGAAGPRGGGGASVLPAPLDSGSGSSSSVASTPPPPLHKRFSFQGKGLSFSKWVGAAVGLESDGELPATTGSERVVDIECVSNPPSDSHQQGADVECTDLRVDAGLYVETAKSSADSEDDGDSCAGRRRKGRRKGAEGKQRGVLDSSSSSSSGEEEEEEADSLPSREGPASQAMTASAVRTRMKAANDEALQLQIIHLKKQRLPLDEALFGVKVAEVTHKLVIRQWKQQFQSEHGRAAASREDLLPMREEYSAYKQELTLKLDHIQKRISKIEFKKGLFQQFVTKFTGRHGHDDGCYS